MAKHAYLIIAHKNDKTFKTLIELLDYKDNDIFIHMDVKVENYSPKATEKLVKKSKVYHSERTDVTWGGYSQINAEMVLLKKATETGKYEYYHLISGEDLPLKKQKDIHVFFDKNKGSEFLSFQSGKFGFSDRIRYWYPMQEKWGRNHWRLTKVITAIQRPFVHRNKGIKFQKGTNWFSITDDLARYTISQEDWVKRVFRKTWCCDEVFLHTLVINSDFKDKLFHHKEDGKKYGWNNTSCMREIDWERGAPYTFRSEDYDMLMKSEMLFARKFDAAIDDNIIDKIKETLAA